MVSCRKKDLHFERKDSSAKYAGVFQLLCYIFFDLAIQPKYQICDLLENPTTEIKSLRRVNLQTFRTAVSFIVELITIFVSFKKFIGITKLQEKTSSPFHRMSLICNHPLKVTAFTIESTFLQ